jgi:hypothetical protein
MRNFILFFSLIFFNLAINAQSLQVSSDGRKIVHADGAVFFWLGDTAWELFHRLDREEADKYLQNRAEKGFTVIQAVVLAELDGLGTPNAYGHLPLMDKDPSRPNEKYFEHVDYIVNKAEQLGFYVGMLPTWGDKVTGRDAVFIPDNAFTYGKFLGERYKDKPIIWILGGDRNPREEIHFEVFRQMAKGLKAGDGGRHLITYHPMGDSNSAAFFHYEDWLDFNMIQSGHSSPDIPNYKWIHANYMLAPYKPTLDAEPIYEDIPVRFWDVKWDMNTMQTFPLPDSLVPRGYGTAYDCRQRAWWAVMSGACGHTYGHNSIWQMWEPRHKAVIPVVGPWYEMLDRPGAFQMGYMKQFLEKLDFLNLFPDQSLFVFNWSQCLDHLAALRHRDGTKLIVYSPKGNSFRISPANLAPGKLQATWFNPSTNEMGMHQIVERKGEIQFDPPSSGNDTDWVLLVEVVI